MKRYLRVNKEILPRCFFISMKFFFFLFAVLNVFIAVYLLLMSQRQEQNNDTQRQLNKENYWTCSTNHLNHEKSLLTASVRSQRAPASVQAGEYGGKLKIFRHRSVMVLHIHHQKRAVQLGLFRSVPEFFFFFLNQHVPHTTRSLF